MNTSLSLLNQSIENRTLDSTFAQLYGISARSEQKDRYQKLLKNLQHQCSPDSALFISAPGRTEIGGNHTDHNHGCVIASAVDLDCVAAVAPADTNMVTLISDQLPEPVKVHLNDLTPRRAEYGTPQALIRGVAAAISNFSPPRGLTAHVHATCLPGTGLSSSAAFSVMIGAAFSFLHLDNQLTPQELAVIAQSAENDFFGKPCGLMDQMASSHGKTIFIDFLKPAEPEIQTISCDFEDSGYQMVIIDTGGSHTSLTPEYASVPMEMKTAAAVIGGQVGRDIDVDKLFNSITSIRDQAGDRSALRLLHFLEENKRTMRMAECLQKRQFQDFLAEVRDSGYSSLAKLQNCSTLTTTREQGILIALAFSSLVCPQSVCRVHGGGFAGTVQAYVPLEEIEFYTEKMEHIFGLGKVYPIRNGRPGVCAINHRGMLLPPGQQD